MTKPILHIPQKDSPETILAVAIDETETTLFLDDTYLFEVDNVTRLTLGIDTPVTETITIVSYEGGPSGDMELLVIRGTPSYSWPEGTLVARVFTSLDLSEVHEYLEDLDLGSVTNGNAHDHDGGDGAPIPAGGLATNAVTTAKILNANVTADKLAADAVITAKILNNAVTTPKIVNDAITADKLAANAVITVKILDDAVTPAKIPNRIRRVFLPVYKYLNMTNPDSVNYAPWNTSAYFGVMLKANKHTGNTGLAGIIPDDYVGDGVIIPVVTTFLGYTTGYHAYFRYEVNVGTPGQRVDSKTLGQDYFYLGQVSVPGVMGQYWLLDMPEAVLPVTEPFVVPGDIMTVEFARWGDNVLDTYPSSLSLLGCIFKYTADS